MIFSVNSSTLSDLSSVTEMARKRSIALRSVKNKLRAQDVKAVVPTIVCVHDGHKGVWAIILRDRVDVGPQAAMCHGSHRDVLEIG